jgi:hypothetical protein
MSGTTTNNGWTYPTSTDLVRNGATAMGTLAAAIDTSLGKVAWQSYTCTISGTGWAIGNGTIAARYVQMGQTVVFDALLTFGSTTTAGSAALQILLPTTSETTFTTPSVHAAIIDASPAASYIGQGSVGSTTVTINCVNAAGTYAALTGVIAGAPLTFAVSDSIRVTGIYETA